MNNPDEVPQPRVIAQIGDDGAENASRLIWAPPRPRTAEECAELNYPPGAMTKGAIIAEATSHDALGAPFWQWCGEVEDHNRLYALILKLHAAYERAMEQRDQISAHAIDAARAYAERLDAMVSKIAARPGVADQVTAEGMANAVVLPTQPDEAHRVLYTAMCRWHVAQSHIPKGVAAIEVLVATHNAAATALRDVFAITDGEVLWRERYRKACQAAIFAREALASALKSIEEKGMYRGVFNDTFGGSAPGGEKPYAYSPGYAPSPAYAAAADASVETVAARARRLTDRFFEKRRAVRVDVDGERRLMYELAFAELQDCEQMERLRQKAPRDTAVGYPDAARPHIVNGEFQSDKYPTTPRGKVPLSVKDAAAQDLLWEYAQRRRAVDAQFSDDLEYALRVAGFYGEALGAKVIAAARAYSAAFGNGCAHAELVAAVAAYEAQLK